MKRFISFALAIALFFAASTLGTAEASADTTELTVALYPYVPRIEQFKTAIRSEWSKKHPKIGLNFVSDYDTDKYPEYKWDGGYEDNPPEKADVYVFDAMFSEYFLEHEMLEPLEEKEIEEFEDFVPYAIKGMKAGVKYYGIPQLGCANVLFYLEGDQNIANAKDLDALAARSACGTCTYTSEIPPDRRGLMVDMKGGTTNAALYLDIAHSIDGEYPFPLPEPNGLKTGVIKKMKQLLSMASYENGTDSNFDGTDDIKAYERAKWFSKGWGRAFVGYTESMSAMDEDTRQGIDFKVMPFSDNNNPPVFYADAIGINTKTKNKELAVELANVMAATKTMVASIGPYVRKQPPTPDGNRLPPQYLMPVRESVFNELKGKDSLYGDMRALIKNDTVMFKLNAESRDWLEDTKDAIRTEARENYPCGCDYKTDEVISSDSSASRICTATCEEYGGWNGEWTNDYPAAQKPSVCGCNSCPSK